MGRERERERGENGQKKKFACRKDDTNMLLQIVIIIDFREKLYARFGGTVVLRGNIRKTGDFEKKK